MKRILGRLSCGGMEPAEAGSLVGRSPAGFAPSHASNRRNRTTRHVEIREMPENGETPPLATSGFYRRSDNCCADAPFAAVIGSMSRRHRTVSPQRGGNLGHRVVQSRPSRQTPSMGQAINQLKLRCDAEAATGPPSAVTVTTTPASRAHRPGPRMSPPAPLDGGSRQSCDLPQPTVRRVWARAGDVLLRSVPALVKPGKAVRVKLHTSPRAGRYRHGWAF